MALRIGDYIVQGDLYHSHNYSVHGYIQLSGDDHTMAVSLTGNPDADLVGKHVHFENREPALPLPEDVAKALAWQQVGPTGTMTADRVVRTLVDPEHPMESAEGPRKRSLYLEWFSQNGRVVIELVDPILEIEDMESVRNRPPDEEFLAEAEAEARAAEAAAASLGEEQGCLDEPPWQDDNPDSFSVDAEDDPYNLFGRQEGGPESPKPEPPLPPPPGEDRFMYEMELMDHMIEHEDGEIINLIFDEPIRLPTPEELTTDEQAEGPLKVVLTRLALFGIALDVCEHYTPRMAYRYLVETMLPNERAYPQMRQTQWVQHFSTSDDCPDCQKEFELPEESD